MTDQPAYKLISFPVCPFVQRSVIILRCKNIAYDIEYIDLADKPDWFLAISPAGKVPVLVTDGEAIFESAIINEFIDETTSPRLLPSDPLQRAKQRAWIAYSQELLRNQFMMMTAKDDAGFVEAKDSLLTNLAKLSEVAPERRNRGEGIDLLDASIAPMFMRLHLAGSVNEEARAQIPADTGIFEWMDWIMDSDEVKGSVIDDFPTVWESYFRGRGSHYLETRNAA